MNLLIVTAILGAASIYAAFRADRTWLTPCIAYWGGWGLMLSLYEVSWRIGLGPQLRPAASTLILEAHAGAAAGFLVASGLIFVRRHKRRASGDGMQNQRLLSRPFALSPKVQKFLLLTYLVVGTVHLLYRLSLLDHIGVSAYYDLRRSYLTNPGPAITRLSNYVFSTVWVTIALFAWEDAYAGLRIKRVFWLILLSGLNGVAEGGRGWLVIIPMTYLFAFLMANETSSAWMRCKKAVRALAPLVVVLLLVFVVLAVLRAPDPADQLAQQGNVPWYQTRHSLMMPLWYATLPLDGIDVMTSYASTHEHTNGQLLFPWFAVQAHRLGLISHVWTQSDALGRDLLVASGDFRGQAQATILPLIASDFGVMNIFYGMAILMGFSQYLAVRLREAGIWQHVFSVMLTLAAFWTISDTNFGVGGNIVGLGFAVLLGFWCSRVPKHAVPSSAVAVPAGSPPGTRELSSSDMPGGGALPQSAHPTLRPYQAGSWPE